MRRAVGERISEVYADARWQPPSTPIRLTADTARALRAEGITMVRVAPSFWHRITGRAGGISRRDISISRFLSATDHGSRD